MIATLVELEKAGVKVHFGADDEVRIVCPFHEDTSPSCFVNIKKERFQCQAASCKKYGDVVTLLAGIKGCTRSVMWNQLAKLYDLDTDVPINAQLIEKWHTNIWQAKPLLDELYKRGLDAETVRERRLGEHNGRITIPIKNESDIYVNIRSYLPGAPGAEKFKNKKGRGKPRLYPLDQLRFKNIVITGGEVKALAGIMRLNDAGIGCITATGGEGSWALDFNERFIGKTVWVVMDIDAGGRNASEIICRTLFRYAQAVHDVVLPLDIKEFPTGDLNDYVTRHNNLIDVLNAAELWKPKKRRTLFDTEPKPVELAKAVAAEHTGERLTVSSVVSVLDLAPYLVPKTIKVDCTRKEKCCENCTIYPNEPTQYYTISPESPALLEMIASHKNAQHEALKSDLNIPMQCRVCSFETGSHYSVEDSRVSSKLEITTRAKDRENLPAFCVVPDSGEGLEVNEAYDMIGRIWPHPKTQQAVMLVSAYKASQDALSSYKCTEPDKLRIFQPTDWTTEALASKLDDIAADFETNVTGIYQRRDMHLAVDLTYHSPLQFDFDGRKAIKGWVESLIVGDSAQGKSEVTLHLQQHYKLGELMDCKNATVPGLLGGLSQSGTRWLVSWGIIPTHDKRLVILEELKGAPVEVISKLTDMRSRGIAEIPKIEKRRTHARTRLCATSNARYAYTIAQYNFGVECIRELIGAPEDIRRFDLCMIAAAGDIDARVINQLKQDRPIREHKYTSVLCRELVLFAWTVNDVQFDDDATKAVLAAAVAMCDKFDESIPIVDKGSMRHKLARLSAALAARTFSVNADASQLIVRKCHVDYIVNFLDKHYSSDSFGYYAYTQSLRNANTITDPDPIIKLINDQAHARDFVDNLLHTNKIELQDICDWVAGDRPQGQAIISLLIRKRALQRHEKHYKKTTAFITLLKGLNVVNRPDHIKDEF